MSPVIPCPDSGTSSIWRLGYFSIILDWIAGDRNPLSVLSTPVSDKTNLCPLLPQMWDLLHTEATVYPENLRIGFHNMLTGVVHSQSI